MEASRSSLWVISRNFWWKMAKWQAKSTPSSHFVIHVSNPQQHHIFSCRFGAFGETSVSFRWVKELLSDFSSPQSELELSRALHPIGSCVVGNLVVALDLGLDCAAGVHSSGLRIPGWRRFRGGLSAAHCDQPASPALRVWIHGCTSGRNICGSGGGLEKRFSIWSLSIAPVLCQ